ncbi:hypothetical protein PMAYCL1PPCAC_14960, partial [Pristionchus mayeri]
ADAFVLAESLDLRGITLAVGEPRGDLKQKMTLALARVLVHTRHIAHDRIRAALVAADGVEALQAVRPLALGFVGAADIRLLRALVYVDDVNDH